MQEINFWEHISWKEYSAAFMVLFSVIDILGSVPIIVSLRKQFGHIESEKASIVSAALMIAFLFVGDRILGFIGVDINSFAIAGAIVIFVIAIEMILGIEINKNSEVNGASIVPIAFPLVAGAGTLTTTLSLRAEYHTVNIIIGILLNTLLIYAVLKSANWIENKIGDATLMIFKKVFGVILLAISVKLFIANFAQLVAKYLHT